MDAQFYKGRGNDVLMTLSNNGAPVLPASITKVEFKYAGERLIPSMTLSYLHLKRPEFASSSEALLFRLVCMQ